MKHNEFFQERMLEKGLLKKEVAKLSGISRTQIDGIWEGILEPNDYQISRISKALGIDQNDIEDAVECECVKKVIPLGKPVHEIEYPKFEAKKSQLKSNHKTPLQPIIEKTCVLTGTPNPERAHYDGIMQHLFGKGLSEKSDNLFVAEISHEKHMEFHDPKTRKSVERSHEFLVAILLTIKRKVENGQIIFKS